MSTIIELNPPARSTGGGRAWTVAVLLAGGSGTRMGMDQPKQFLTIGGRTVLEHTLDTFESAACIDEIVVVINPAWIETARLLIDGMDARKVSAIIPGGETRNASTAAALAHFSEAPGETKLLIHDAVRPLVTEAILERCVAALEGHDAVDVVSEVEDTIVEVHDGIVTRIPPRAHLRRGQTPQGFRLRLLRDAYATHDAAELDHFTDDCAVVMSAFPHTPVLAVPGSPDNIKITRAIDIYLADRLMQLKRSHTAPLDRSARPTGVVAVIGGSSGIGAASVSLLDSLGWNVVSLSRRDGGVDVRDERSITEALVELRRRVGPIAAVVNCAGVLMPGQLAGLDARSVHEQLEVNLTGAIHVARASHELLAETRGHLLLFTSSSYTRGRSGYAVYSATKAAVVNLTQGLSEEWRQIGVKVNCINPARTDTPMRTRAFGAEPAGTLLDATSVARTVLEVLCGGDSGHIYDVRRDPARRQPPALDTAAVYAA